MPNIAIETAAPADVEVLLDMMQDFNALEAIEWSKVAGAPSLARLLAEPDLGEVCKLVEGARLAGYFVVTWGYDLEWGGRDAFLTEFYLVPAARGRGLGRAALELVERRAAERGARALHLMVRHENAAAMRLYEGAGFVSPPRRFMSKVLARS
jgi:ribosomal protein S18 acetylase RimI-like enzyme